MKNFNEIVAYLREKNIIESHGELDAEITDITFDSRKVKPGTLFIAKGQNFKEDYLLSAIENGAVAYMSESIYNVDIASIQVRDIKDAMLILANYFFDFPDTKLKLIGVTGTKGKSTVVSMIKKVMDEYMKNIGEKPVGIISSIQTFDGINDYSSSLTTPEAVELYRNLDNAVKSGLKYLVMEISSQALKYQRVGLEKYDQVVLLNIDKDHIGSVEHPNLEDYIESKLKILDLSENILYYKASDNLDRIESKLKDKKVLTYDIENPSVDFNITNIKHKYGENTFTLNNQEYKLSMFGDYNILNAAVAIIIAKKYGADDETISKVISSFNLPSRSNFLSSKDKKILALVDYSHNKLSFEKNFEVFKNSYPEYRIHSIFGASGGKGLNRRKDLPEIASIYSDKIYLVPDDPGFDNPAQISLEMSRYISEDIEYEMFETRELGIKKAVEDIKDKTILFVAGKGIENYQSIMGKHEDMKSDYEVTMELIKDYDQLN